LGGPLVVPLAAANNTDVSGAEDLYCVRVGLGDDAPSRGVERMAIDNFGSAEGLVASRRCEDSSD